MTRGQAQIAAQHAAVTHTWSSSKSEEHMINSCIGSRQGRQEASEAATGEQKSPRVCGTSAALHTLGRMFVVVVTQKVKHGLINLYCKPSSKVIQHVCCEQGHKNVQSRISTHTYLKTNGRWISRACRLVNLPEISFLHFFTHFVIRIKLAPWF